MIKNTEQLSYFGSICAFFAGLTLSDIASIFGILFGLATVLTNWYYKKKDFELRKLEVEGKINGKKNR
ncbi:MULTISPECIES: HP1 family phage holin [Rodentibacter]|uniref:HP1 family phage holin n=1 Tax=Rodentibacter TaxID=1960084 RepID=UPI001CFCAD46|nr:HP1 family phage holin [Rodentibacter sp. JRC1]GJI55912.1 hypothetical protein HEMROJRC1_10240 [Rodentibacter sp. JRC1]